MVIFLFVLMNVIFCSVRLNFTFIQTGPNFQKESFATPWFSNFSELGYPGPRHYHSLAVSENKLALWGGIGGTNGTNNLGDFWIFHLDEERWEYLGTEYQKQDEPIRGKTHPGGGFGANMLYHDGYFYLLFGYRYGLDGVFKPRNDIFRNDGSTHVWENVTINSTFNEDTDVCLCMPGDEPFILGARYHSCSIIHNPPGVDPYIYIIGGFARDTYGTGYWGGCLNDVWRINMLEMKVYEKFFPKEESGSGDCPNYDDPGSLVYPKRPAGRAYHSCWSTENYVFVYGGQMGGGVLSIHSQQTPPIIFSDLWKFGMPGSGAAYWDPVITEQEFQGEYPDPYPGKLRMAAVASIFKYPDSNTYWRNDFAYLFFGSDEVNDNSTGRIWKFNDYNKNFMYIQDGDYNSESWFSSFEQAEAFPSGRTGSASAGGMGRLYLFGGMGKGESTERNNLGDLYVISDSLIDAPVCFGEGYAQACMNNGHFGGKCVYWDTCECHNDWHYEKDGDTNQCFTYCFDQLSNDTVDACNGNGRCILWDHCVCDPGYSGKECEFENLNGEIMFEFHESDELQKEAHISQTEWTSHFTDDTTSYAYPGPRSYHNIASSPTQLALWGGFMIDDSTVLGDFWVYDYDTSKWQFLGTEDQKSVDCDPSSTHPGCGCGGVFVYNPTDEYFYLVTGWMYDSSGDPVSRGRNSVYRNNATTHIWENIQIQSDSLTTDKRDVGSCDDEPYRPSGRWGSCSVFLETSQELYIYAGDGIDPVTMDLYIPSVKLNDIWMLKLDELSSSSWNPIWPEEGTCGTGNDLGSYPPKNYTRRMFLNDQHTYRPSSRVLPICWENIDRDGMFIFGGFMDGAEYVALSDLWKFSFESRQFTFYDLRNNNTESVSSHAQSLTFPHFTPGALYGQLGSMTVGNASYIFSGRMSYGEMETDPFVRLGAFWRFDMLHEKFVLVQSRKNDDKSTIYTNGQAYPSPREFFGAASNPKGEKHKIILFGGWGFGWRREEDCETECNILGDLYTNSGTSFEEIPRCHGLAYPNACGRPEMRGVCVLEEVCDCSVGYFGSECTNVTYCNGTVSTDTETVCHGHGICMNDSSCQCYEGYYGDGCSINECYGVFGNDSENVCSGGRGACIEFDECDCYEHYFGARCETTICGGHFSNQSELVCSGKGMCVDFEVCQCFSNYTGLVCNITTCFGVYSNYSDTCYGHGSCFPYDHCECEVDFFDANCDNWNCSDISRLSTSRVCSGHGVCISPNNCSCEDEDYGGDGCHLWYCGTYRVDDVNNVCSGHGSCLDVDSCFCLAGYSSSSIGTWCDLYYCGQYESTDPIVCSEHGECLGSHDCSCTDDFEGELCETWSCGYDKDSPYTCNGHGKCLQPSTCECSGGYVGEDCSTNILYLTVMTPILSLFGLFVVFACFVMCMFCILCFCACLCVLCFLSCTVVNQKSEMKRFSRLKNFDVLLREQELEDSQDIAHLRINKSLFEIEYDEVKFLKIIGEGGSSSVVYKCNWKNQIVAFKCFKTRVICSNQSSFDEFEREVSVLGSINHPHVIQFLGACLKPPRVGILMEYCENGDLNVFLKKYKMKHDEISYPYVEKLRICEECIRSMVYIHSKNIIHRDLKLENVLLDGKCSIKLMDFGLSKIVDRMSSAKTKFIGTNIYISPEVILESHYDSKCDVFSFGMMVYIIFTEIYHPYGKDESHVEIKVANDPNFRPDMLEIMKSSLIPSDDEKKWIRSVVENCLDHESEKRMSFDELFQTFSKRGRILEMETETIEKKEPQQMKKHQEEEEEEENDDDEEEEEEKWKSKEKEYISQIESLKEENKMLRDELEMMKEK